MLPDTSGLLAYVDKSEPSHAEAARLMLSASIRLTHNYVLAELVALAHSRRIPRGPILALIEGLTGEAGTTVVFVGRSLHGKAVDLLNRRLDKTWSLCDAVSFLLMRRYRLTEALTTDHHFEQAGFVRLLRA